MQNPERAKQPVLGFQSLDKASGKEVLIRNDGVYVISGIFREQMPCICGEKYILVPIAGRRSPRSGA